MDHGGRMSQGDCIHDPMGGACALHGLRRAVARLSSLLVLLLFMAVGHMQGICVQDDGGRAVCLASPARRNVRLAPHATEILYAIGAHIVAAANYREPRKIQLSFSQLRLNLNYAPV